MGQSKGEHKMKVYVVRRDVGSDYEPYYVIVGVYANEKDAEAVCLNTKFDCEEYEIIEKKETPC
jgi:hypothetical protein